MPTRYKNRMNRVKGNRWYPSNVDGKPRSLRNMILAAVKNPGCADEYFSRPAGSWPRVSFHDFVTDWFDSESDPHTLDEVLDSIELSTQTAACFHTTGWESGTAGLTLAEIIVACDEAEVTIRQFADALKNCHSRKQCCVA